MRATSARRGKRRAHLLALASALTVVGSLAAGPSAGAAPAALPNLHASSADSIPWPSNVASVCPTQLCLAVDRTDISPVTDDQLPQGAVAPGYGPNDLQDAYNLPSHTAGSGKTVALVEAFDDPNLASDLAVYRKRYGLPACTKSTGCLRQVNQRGGSSLPTSQTEWAAETSLDVDMVSAICPLCHILVVEADDQTAPDFAEAERTAGSLGAKFISNSYGLPEWMFGNLTAYDSAYDQPGVAITASTGDSDYSNGVLWPASAPDVVAVGGTSLLRAQNSRGWNEIVWLFTGSGCSDYAPKPSRQKDGGCSRRMTGDVAAVADPGTGVSVYDTFGGMGGWHVFGGTSASSPIIAAVYALAGTPGSAPQNAPYNHHGSLYDIVAGTNSWTECAYDYPCNAEVGYDGPTGWGTPNGTGGFVS